MSDGKALAPGTVIGRRYVILAAEGRAGDCLHYRAEEIDTAALLAIAEYFPDGVAARTPEGAVAPASDATAPLYEEGRRRFLSRAHGLLRLADPRLASSRAPIEERNTAYAIIEPVNGPTLAAWARNLGHSPSQGEFDGLLAPVLDALAALHGAGLLHLAITPDAIVLRDGREPVLTRLWVGALLPAKAPHPAETDAGCTAPELLAEQPSEIGPRTDIYGLAATIYVLLTGTPFARSAPAEGETWIPPAIPTTGTDYRPEFLQGVATSLAPDPSRRPPSAAALKSLFLDAALTEEPSSISEKAPKTQASATPSDGGVRAPIASANPPQRQPRMRVPWLMILLLGGGILAGLSYLGMRPTLPPPKGETTPAPQRPATTNANPPAPGAKEEPRPQDAAKSIPQRIAETTDRNELLLIAEAAPAHRGDVEARLIALGYLRLVKRDAVVWLRPGRDESFSECDDCPEMVALPAATFLMGSPSTEAGRQDDEDDTPGPGGNPVSVTIARPFAIGQYEVTRGQFAAFVKATGYRLDLGCYAREGGRQLRPELSWAAPGFEQDDRHPVTCVSWRDAVAYVHWLSATTGASYRLLTEAEWEYAARGGSTARFAFGDEDIEICKYGNGADLTSREADPDWIVALCRDGLRFTAPVGSFIPNGFGLYDMHGNLWEWVEDCESNSLRHLSSLEASGVTGASRSCSSNMGRILRGGSWSDPPQRLRSAARIAGPPDARDHIVGFRVARTLERR
jgi:formylglycine-generating enzyme required for sulfatase activity/serine/threonine protein kinase